MRAELWLFLLIVGGACTREPPQTQHPPLGGAFHPATASSSIVATPSATAPGPATPQTAQVSHKEAAPPSSSSPPSEVWLANTSVEREANDQDQPFPEQLLRDNFWSTDVTALVRIVAGTVRDPHPGFGYVNHIYRARLLRALRGEPEPSFEYSVMAERDLKLFLPPYPVVVSLCRTPDQSLYVPDNGYVSPAPPALQRAAARLAERPLPQPIPSACAPHTSDTDE